MELSDNNLIVTHNGIDRCNHTVLCNTIFDNSIYYFEMKIIKIIDCYDICIGIMSIDYTIIEMKDQELLIMDGHIHWIWYVYILSDQYN